MTVRIGPTLGFERFTVATTAIAGIESGQRVRKRQLLHDTLNVQGQAAPAIWHAALTPGLKQTAAPYSCCFL